MDSIAKQGNSGVKSAPFHSTLESQRSQALSLKQMSMIALTTAELHARLF